ncbi:hypothetical protein EDD21DRAFT_16023 [Dissophora ornata]|nr:hypothetical protein EDD21DRAFT_16023 [Dissophora ornata]
MLFSYGAMSLRIVVSLLSTLYRRSISPCFARHLHFFWDIIFLLRYRPCRISAYLMDNPGGVYLPPSGCFKVQCNNADCQIEMKKNPPSLYLTCV